MDRLNETLRNERRTAIQARGRGRWDCQDAHGDAMHPDQIHHHPRTWWCQAMTAHSDGRSESLDSSFSGPVGQ